MVWIAKNATLIFLYKKDHNIQKRSQLISNLHWDMKKNVEKKKENNKLDKKIAAFLLY